VQRRAVPIFGGIAVIAGSIVALGLVTRCGSHAPADRSRAPAAAPRPNVATAARTPEITAPYPEVTPPEAVPASLEGTEADGEIEADAAGHLVIDLELRRLFDHFLAASGEEPIATMRARIIAVLRQRLPATAAAEALEILDRYLGYRDAARRLVVPASAAAGLDQVHDLRAAWFSPAVAKAFFADEEAAIYAALARRDVVADPALAPADRERRLADIEARTPVAIREARAAALAPLNELNHETAMRAAGATDQEITAARTATLGAAAAGRLAELDRAHAAWDARLAAFRAARAALYADPRLDAAERDRRIDDLLARTFTPPERIRVDALDRRAGPPGSAAP